MRTFARDELLAFLHQIDEQIEEPVAMEMIGGAAALLAYGAQSPTKDIDSLASIDERIREASRHTTLERKRSGGFLNAARGFMSLVR